MINPLVDELAGTGLIPGAGRHGARRGEPLPSRAARLDLQGLAAPGLGVQRFAAALERRIDRRPLADAAGQWVEELDGLDLVVEESFSLHTKVLVRAAARAAAPAPD